MYRDGGDLRSSKFVSFCRSTSLQAYTSKHRDHREEQRDRSEGSPKGTQRRGWSVGMVGLEPMEEPTGTGIPTLWCFLMRQHEASTGGTEMNSRVQLPIRFSTSQWNGHRSTFVLCKARKYAHTIFIGTDCIMNRPPSSRFPDHPVVTHPYILLHLQTSASATSPFCFLTNYFQSKVFAFEPNRFINIPMR